MKVLSILMVKANRLRLHNTFEGVLREKIRTIEEEADKPKTTECHSAELIEYQTQPLLQKYCTMLISKYQSLKECQVFSLFLLVIFL